jgi:monovalent cation:H+ antiporter, CPA1 family
LISVASITFVIAGFLVLASVVQPAAERLHLPYTVLLAVVGVAIGGVSSFLLYTPLTDVFDNIVRPVVDLPFNASIFLIVFLPLLLFHAALTLDLRELAPDWAPILLLAIVAVFAAAAAIGFSLSFAAGIPLTVALLLGAIVATTDPAAVVAIFRELGAPPRLSRLLEGESLLNDAAAIVLFSVLLPLLSALHLSQKVSATYKLAIAWGGLRGAVTLALALAVTENTRIAPEVRNAVAVLATGFVLFTLLVNGLTLRPVIRLLKLDRLSPLNLALRNKVMALSLVDVRDALAETASQYSIPPDVARWATEAVDRRIDELSAQPDLEQAISDRDRIRIGLVALANRERRIILDHHAQRTVSGAAIERLLRNTNLILDAARAEGRIGYNRAARALFEFERSFWIANLLHRTLKLARPLQRQISIRFETLLIRRLALEELFRFVDSRLAALLGQRVAELLGEVIAARNEATIRALDALRLQYPEYAEALEQRFLRQSGFRLSLSRFHDLYDEGLIGKEVFEDLEREHAAVRSLMDEMPPLDLGLRAEDLLAQFDMFAGFGAAELRALARLFRPRLLVPDEVVIRKGERGNAMFLISSGAVEVVLPNQRVRLGSGDFFGEMALLSGRPRQADVVALGYCRGLVLSAADFRRFLRDYPRARAEINRVAKERARVNEEKVPV